MSRFLFDNPVMLKFGKMSYALYVMHNPVWRWLRATATKDNFHPTYKYWIFGRDRLNYNQAPIAFFLAVCVAWAMSDIDAMVSPKLNNFLLRLFGLLKEPKKIEAKAIEIVSV